MKRVSVAVIVGTRPEAIKMAPVIQALQGSKVLRPLVVSTSQHRSMAGQALASFGLQTDYELHVMRQGQTLWSLAARLAQRLGDFFEKHRVKAVLVQGDTSSALFGGLAAYYHQFPIGHVEAGLRTGNPYAPFPEEMNRRLLAPLARWHFAPTRSAMNHLLSEGVRRSAIFVTGNTVVDALRAIVPGCNDEPLRRLIGAERLKRRLILVTCHRRESLGKPMHQVAIGLRRLALRNPETVILFPVHPNPAVKAVVSRTLQRLPNVVCCEPLDYKQFLSCLKHAYIVISDSGGLQEEATVLGKPVLVLREETERTEGIRAGALKLVGTNPGIIVREAERLLRDAAAYRNMSRSSKVFGDGRAALRIVRVLEQALKPRAVAPLRRSAQRF